MNNSIPTTQKTKGVPEKFAKWSIHKINNLTSGEKRLKVGTHYSI